MAAILLICHQDIKYIQGVEYIKNDVAITCCQQDQLLENIQVSTVVEVGWPTLALPSPTKKENILINVFQLQGLHLFTFNFPTKN